LECIAQESAYDSILVAAKLNGFPAIMFPSEILRVIRLMPWVIVKLFPINLTMTTIPNWFFAERFRLRFLQPRQYNKAAMQDIIERPWFGRMWALQELVMAG